MQLLLMPKTPIGRQSESALLTCLLTFVTLVFVFRHNSETGIDPLTDLGVEIACLRGELQCAREIHTEQQIEINRLRREIDYLSAAKAEQTVELGRMRHLMENMTSVDVSAEKLHFETL